MAIARVGRERVVVVERSIDCNACHQMGGVGRGGFGARQLTKKRVHHITQGRFAAATYVTKHCMWLARLTLFILYHEIFTNCKLYDASNLETLPHYLMQVHNFTLGDACTNMWLAMSAFFFFCAVNSLPTVNSLKLLL